MENGTNKNLAKIELPEDVMTHLRLAARETLRAELAFIKTSYDENETINGDEFAFVMFKTILPKMMEEMALIFDEVCEEEGL